MDQPARLSVTQAAERLGISKYQVYRRIMRGDLPARKIQASNVHWVIAEKDLDAYIAAGGGEVLSPPRVDERADADNMRVPEVAMLTGYSAETIRRQTGVRVHSIATNACGRARQLDSATVGTAPVTSAASACRNDAASA